MHGRTDITIGAMVNGFGSMAVGSDLLARMRSGLDRFGSVGAIGIGFIEVVGDSLTPDRRARSVAKIVLGTA
jgi:hypothetical protein